MSFYLDTSFVVSAFSKETRSLEALAWLDSHIGLDLYTSGWVSTEFASAISLKIRTGQFNSADLNYLQNEWTAFRSSNLRNVAIDNSDYELAAQMVFASNTGLRSGDALHLAICQRIGARIVTFDNGLERAANQFDIPATIP